MAGGQLLPPTPWGVCTLAPGDPWYLLLKAPVRQVGGWGAFAAYEELPASAAWGRIGPANGVPDLAALVAKTTGCAGRRSVHPASRWTLGEAPPPT